MVCGKILRSNVQSGIYSQNGHIILKTAYITRQKYIDMYAEFQPKGFNKEQLRREISNQIKGVNDEKH